MSVKKSGENTRYLITKMHEMEKRCKSYLLIHPSEHSGYQSRSIMDVTWGPGGPMPLQYFLYLRIFSLATELTGKVKGKAVPLQAWSGPEGSRKLRFPDFMTTAQDGGKVVSLTHRPPLPPGNAPSTHFCQRLSRPQGHSAIGRILCQ